MISSFFYINNFYTMNEVLCAVTSDNETFPINIVFRETLFEEFLNKFPEALKIFLSDEEIKYLNDCKYEDFCDYIRNKVNNLFKQEEFIQ